MSRDDLFNINAKIVKGLAEACAKNCPKAIVLLITNPVNSVVPIACEVFKKAGCFDAKRIIGVSTLDVLRANTFLAKKLDCDVNHADVPVIGGHAGETILALFSQAKPSTSGLSQQDIVALDKHVQDAGTEVVEAKAGAGSATLSMAYAASKFADAVIRAQTTKDVVIECCYVNNGGDDYIAGKVQLGPGGAEKLLPNGPLSSYEQKRFDEAKAKLAGDIKTGLTFARA